METNNTLVLREKYDKIAGTVENYVNANQVEIIHKNVAKGTSIDELAYFLNVSKSVGLSPFNKEIWCYKDNKGNLLIFAGRDGFLKKAQENTAFNGIRSCEIKEKDEYEIDIPSGKITHKIKDITSRGKIIGAYAFVFRKDGEPTISFVEFSRYDKKHNTWISHPEDMIKKVAECKALKLAFGISQLQIEDEFNIKNNIAIPVNSTPVLTPADVVKQRFIDWIDGSTTLERLQKINDEVYASQDKAIIEMFELKVKELNELHSETIENV